MKLSGLALKSLNNSRYYVEVNGRPGRDRWVSSIRVQSIYRIHASVSLVTDSLTPERLRLMSHGSLELYGLGPFPRYRCHPAGVALSTPSRDSEVSIACSGPIHAR